MKNEFEWVVRETPNDDDFAGEVQTKEGDSICAVYSQRHLEIIAAVPEMVGIINFSIKHIDALRIRDNGAMVNRMKEIVQKFKL